MKDYHPSPDLLKRFTPGTIEPKAVGPPSGIPSPAPRPAERLRAGRDRG